MTAYRLTWLEGRRYVTGVVDAESESAARQAWIDGACHPEPSPDAHDLRVGVTGCCAAPPEECDD